MFLERLDTVIAFAVVMLLLSLLVTTLVQMAMLVLGTRGRNLRWGIERLLGQVSPDLGASTREIAEKVLRHPTISHLGRQRAVAVRKEELARLLAELAADRVPQFDPWLRRTLRRLVPDVLRVPLARLFPHPAKRLSPHALAALQSVSNQTVPAATIQQIAQVQAAAAAVSDLLPSQAAAVQAVVSQALAQTDKLSSELNAWFDTVMDRTSERFKLVSRWVTGLFALLIAFGYQVDSLDIIRQLSNKEVREGVIQLYDPALRLYDEVNGYTEQRLVLASTVLNGLKEDPALKPAFGNLEVPPTLELPGEGAAWIEANLKPRMQEQAYTQLVTAYRAKYDENATALTTKFEDSAGKTQKLLAQTGLLVIPAKRQPFWNEPYWTSRKWAGVLATVFFLSLGAPFWYNALRKLADLRPIVARRVEGEAPKAVR